MVLTLALTALKSRQVRNSVASFGVRRFAANAVTNVDDAQPGIVNKVLKGFTRFGGFIVANLKNMYAGRFQLNFTAVWQKIVQGTQFLLNFNWNITDAQLDAQIKQGTIALASQAGATVGGALGYLICGAIPGAAMLAVNEPMAMYALSELGEEAADEIASNIASLLNLLAQQTIRYAFMTIYKNFRHILRPAALGVAKILVTAGILDQESVEKANKNKNEPWSFAQALEDTVDRIKDPIKQAYVEEFWEELGDSCIEAGYVVANAVDSFFAQQRMSNEMFFGKEKTVEIILNRDAEV